MLGCAVALVLLLDGSASMWQDFNTQREQTARAIESAEVVQAIQREGGVAVAVMQFAERPQLEVAWRHLKNETDAQNLAAAVRGIRFMSGRATEIGAAIRGATAQMEGLDVCVPDQQIIDISTDGVDPYLRDIAAARDAAQDAGIRINVIAVGVAEDAELLRENAMTADGFVLHTESWANYPALFRRKIILELAGR